MNILLLKGFNNYFNRIVKKYSTIADYKTKSSSYLEYSNINFNPLDGVATELVIGSQNQQEPGSGATTVPLTWDVNGTPDYCICYELEGTPSVPVIKFRWFVLESERTRNGQYRIALKRDVLADNFDAIMNAPCYVEKGMITNNTDPLLFNTEGTIPNQIKQSETLLKDSSKCAWLVGYIKKDLGQKTITGTPKSATLDVDVLTDMSDLPDACITYRNASGTATQSATKTAIVEQQSKMHMGIQFKHASLTNWHGLSAPATAGACNWQIDLGSVSDSQFAGWNGLNHWAIQNTNFWLSTSGEPEAMCNNIKNYTNSDASILSKWNNLVNNCSSQIRSDANVQVYNSDVLAKYNNKYIYKENVLYKLSISLSQGNDYAYTKSFSSSETSGYANTYFSAVAAKNDKYSADTSTSTKDISYSLIGKQYTIIAQEVSVPGTLSATLPAATGRKSIDDELFDMFVIPYLPNNSSEIIKFASNMLNSEASLFMAQQIMNELQVQTAGADAYDLQLLPYCPINLEADEYNNIAISSLTENVDYIWITDTNNVKKSIIFFPTKANFTKNINYTAELEYSTNHSLQYDHKTKQLAKGNHAGYSGYRIFSIDSEEWIGDIDLSSIGIGTLIINDTSYNVIAILPVYSLFTGKLDSLTIVTSMTYEQSEASTISATVTLLMNYDSVSAPEDNPLNGIIDIKISNECDFMRLTSPNFNGMFEFKLSKLNQQKINYINVDCTYKPYNPYIKLNPDFSGLYGADFNDSTGLILGGDFSLATLNDQWKQYQLNNKNYQNIFNRQIQNLDVTQTIAKEQLEFNNTLALITGMVGGGIAGAAKGGKAGAAGAIGGLVGGTILGGTLAGIRGEKTEDWLLRNQEEAKQYAIDMYKYQLGNIQALPQSISKSDPLTYNNKIWPIIEKFSCTEKEKEILKNKIKYNSMTIMAIGTLADYSFSKEFNKVYVKGQLIRLENINDDFHVADAIYQEVNKGFFVIQGE